MNHMGVQRVHCMLFGRSCLKLEARDRRNLRLQRAARSQGSSLRARMRKCWSTVNRRVSDEVISVFTPFHCGHMLMFAPKRSAFVRCRLRFLHVGAIHSTSHRSSCRRSGSRFQVSLPCFQRAGQTAPPASNHVLSR